MYEKINQIMELIKEIQEENEVVGEILFVNYISAINTIEAISKDIPVDISEKIELLSALLGIDTEMLVKTILEKDYINNQNGDFVDSEEADADTIDFIVGNSNNINNTKESMDDYEKFLSENKVKENMDYLKGEI